MIVQIPSPAQPLTVPLRGQTPLPTGPRETPRPGPLRPQLFSHRRLHPRLYFSSYRLWYQLHLLHRPLCEQFYNGETVASRPPQAPQPSSVYANSVVQVPNAPRAPNLMVRVRGTTPIPDHEPELVPQQPASPVLVPPSRHSASGIGVDQPRSSTLTPEEGHYFNRLRQWRWKSDMSDHHKRENEEQLALLQRLLACESVSTLIPALSDILSLQPIKRMSSIAIAKRSRPCGKLPKNTFHLIFPTIWTTSAEHSLERSRCCFKK